MSDDPVKVALEKAAEKLCARRGEHASWCGATSDAAAAIAAFLRALPVPSNGHGWTCVVLADHVEKAARDA